MENMVQHIISGLEAKAALIQVEYGTFLTLFKKFVPDHVFESATYYMDITAYMPQMDWIPM